MQTLRSASLPVALLTLALILGFTVGNQATLHADAEPAPESPKTPWVQTELYFSIALEGSPESAERAAQWQVFVNEVITPRLPEGLTIIDGIGQWKSDRHAEPPRLTTCIVLAVHPDEPAFHARLQEIRDAWLELTGQQSVLRVVTPVSVDF